jgi:hypothetical protein
MRTNSFLLVLMFFLIIPNGCNKDESKDNYYSIAISALNDKIEYNVGDQIEFTCIVKKNNSPASGIILGIDDELSLVCTQLDPTDLNGITKYICSARESGSFSFGFYNNLVSGNYSIHIKENESNDTLLFMNNYSLIDLGENRNKAFEDLKNDLFEVGIQTTIDAMTDPLVVGSGVFCIIGAASTATGIGATWGVPIAAVACPTFTSTAAWELLVDLVKNSVQKFESDAIQREKLLSLTNAADITHSIVTFSETIATSAKSGHNILSYRWDTYQGKYAGIKILNRVAEASDNVYSATTIPDPKIEIINETSFVCTFDVPVNYSSYLELTDERHLISLGISVNNLLPENGLVAYYPLSENANDESGNHYDGIIQGNIQFTDYGAYFPGTLTDYIMVSSFPAITQSFSITAHVQPLLLSWNPIVEISNGTTEEPLAFWIGSSQVGVDLNGFTNPSPDRFPCMKDTSLSTNMMYFLTSTYDYINGVIKIYIDGKEVKNCSTNVPIHSNESQSLYFGESFLGTKEKFKGYMRDIRIYNRALSNEEIQELYHESGW